MAEVEVVWPENSAATSLRHTTNCSSNLLLTITLLTLVLFAKQLSTVGSWNFMSTRENSQQQQRQQHQEQLSLQKQVSRRSIIEKIT